MAKRKKRVSERNPSRLLKVPEEGEGEIHWFFYLVLFLFIALLVSLAVLANLK